MDQLPNWLSAAIDAAGISTVYNADDWIEMTKAPDAADTSSNDDDYDAYEDTFPPTLH